MDDWIPPPPASFGDHGVSDAGNDGPVPAVRTLVHYLVVAGLVLIAAGLVLVLVGRRRPRPVMSVARVALHVTDLSKQELLMRGELAPESGEQGAVVELALPFPLTPTMRVVFDKIDGTFPPDTRWRGGLGEPGVAPGPDGAAVVVAESLATGVVLTLLVRGR